MDDTNLMADAPEAAAPAADAAPAAAPVAAVAGDAQQPAADAGADAQAEAKPAVDAVVIPEKYEFNATEGFEINEALASEFTPVLQELKLTQEQADKLVAFAPRLISESVDSAVNKTLDSIGYGGAKEWANQSRADKEFGGDKLTQNLGVVKAARDQFASPELRKLLETTPLGNHPEIVRLFYRVGKSISPDGYVPSGKAAAATNTAQSIYSNSKMNP
jgi:hypothetical protein